MPRIAQIASLCVAAVFLVAALPAARADNTHSGKVVSVTEGKNGAEGKLVMTDDNGKNEHSHAIASSTKITRDGKTVKLDDLKKGDSIQVTTAEGGKVTEVAAKAGSGSRTGPGSSSGSDKEKIPNALEKLNLSSQQKDKIEGIMRDYDSKLQSAWEEFSDRYQDAIGLEASMLAAMEDSLNDRQKERVHEHRGKAAKGEANDNDRNSSANDPTQNKNATAPKTAANTNPNNANPKNANQGNTNQNNQRAGNPAEEEIIVIGITLSPEQQEAADKLHRQYFDRLRSIGQDLGRLHARLVALETEKIVNIEKVLTKDQLAQLRKQDEDSSSSSTAGKEGATKK